MGKEPYVSTLKKWGWKGEDYSKDSIRIKESYRPVYSDAEAENLGRWWSHNDDHVKSRKDGWATYFRFYAWLARQYDRVLITDLDVFFTENPDPHVVEIPANVTFLASLEMKTHRKFGYKGLNSHMMAITPSNATFHELLLRAQRGEYIPLRNTDEDVLESIFPPRLTTMKGISKKTGLPYDMWDLVPHVHYNYARCPLKPPKPKPANWMPSNCAEVLNYCNFSGTGFKRQYEELLTKCT